MQNVPVSDGTKSPVITTSTGMTFYETAKANIGTFMNVS